MIKLEYKYGELQHNIETAVYLEDNPHTHVSTNKESRIYELSNSDVGDTVEQYWNQLQTEVTKTNVAAILQQASLPDHEIWDRDDIYRLMNVVHAGQMMLDIIVAFADAQA